MYVLGDMKSFLFGGVLVAFLAEVENLCLDESEWWSVPGWWLPTVPPDMILSAAEVQTSEPVIKSIV